MIDLFLFNLRRRSFLLILIALLLPLMLYFMGSFSPIAEDEDIRKTISVIEIYYVFLGACIFCSTISTKYESELIVTKGRRIWEIALCDFTVFYIVLYITGAILGTVFLPYWIHFRFLISFATTLFSALSLSALIRFSINIHFANYGVFIFAFVFLLINSGISPNASITVESCKYDLFLNAYSHQIFGSQNSYWYISDSIWITNRIIFLAAGLICFALAFIATYQRRIYK